MVQCADECKRFPRYRECAEWVCPRFSDWYKYELLSRSDQQSVFTIQESGNQIGLLAIGAADDVTASAAYAGENYYAFTADGQASTIPALVGNTSTLKIIYNDPSTIATGYINWIELTYQEQLAAVSDALLFTSPDTTASVEYDLSGFSTAQFSVFDVTGFVKVMQPQIDTVAGTYLFRDHLTGGEVKRYWAGTTAAYKTPLSFVRIPNTNLRGGIPGADFVIVTHHDFVSEALRLAAYKESLPGTVALNTAVVEVDTIYNEFGNGLPDPVAIRDFLIRHE